MATIRIRTLLVVTGCCLAAFGGFLVFRGHPGALVTSADAAVCQRQVFLPGHNHGRPGRYGGQEQIISRLLACKLEQIVAVAMPADTVSSPRTTRDEVVAAIRSDKVFLRQIGMAAAIAYVDDDARYNLWIQRAVCRFVQVYRVQAPTAPCLVIPPKQQLTPSELRALGGEALVYPSAPTDPLPGRTVPDIRQLPECQPGLYWFRHRHDPKPPAGIRCTQQGYGYNVYPTNKE